MSLHLEEFLYRGRPEGSDQPPAYHVVLASTGEDAFGSPKIDLSPPLTPERAAALGYPLPTLLEEINTAVMAERAVLAERVDALGIYASAWEDNAGLSEARFRTLEAALADAATAAAAGAERERLLMAERDAALADAATAAAAGAERERLFMAERDTAGVHASQVLGDTAQT